MNYLWNSKKTAICLIIFFSEIAMADFALIENKIDSLNFDQAQKLFEDLGDEKTKLPMYSYLMGKYMFYRGELDKSIHHLKNAVTKDKSRLAWRSLLNRANSTKQVYKSMKTYKNSSRFIFGYSDGDDFILTSYAQIVARRQLGELKSLLKEELEHTVRIDFFRNIESFAIASGLSVEQIERTGTVGVSKYGKIMMISPIKLARGYPWMNTLAHELTHLVINKASGDKAPIWLHEGIAKLLEHRWKGQKYGELLPEEAYLLDRAAVEGRLIPLRKFHPSVAFLSNQEDAALAYAQVLSYLLYLQKRMPENWLGDLLNLLKNGETFDNAFFHLSNRKFKKSYRWWKQLVSGRRQTPVPSVNFMKRQFVRGKISGAYETSLLDVVTKRHIRLGDLLRPNHSAASVIEYNKALLNAKNPLPNITNRLAGALLELEKYDEVIEICKKTIGLYLYDATSNAQMGQAYFHLGEHDLAIGSLKRSIEVNPFNPEVHSILYESYLALGEKDKAQIELENARLILSGSK